MITFGLLCYLLIILMVGFLKFGLVFEFFIMKVSE